MKRLLSVSVILVILSLLVIPAELFAKAHISKIVIKGADLNLPVEITDSKTLANLLCLDGYGDRLHPLPSPKSRKLHR